MCLQISSIFTFTYSNLVSLPQTASMLSAVPSALEECVHSVPDPQHLKTVLLHHTALGHFDLSGESHLGCMYSIVIHIQLNFYVLILTQSLKNNAGIVPICKPQIRCVMQMFLN